MDPPNAAPLTMYKEADYSLFRFAVTRHPVVFCFVHLVVILWHTYVVWKGDWHWSLVPMTLAVEVGYWIGTNMHRNRLRKLNEKGPGIKHRSDVLEEADPVRWKDGGPLMELHIWYAAICDMTWGDAQGMIGAMDTSALEGVKAQHARYLNRKEFDKFLRK